MTFEYDLDRQYAQGDTLVTGITTSKGLDLKTQFQKLVDYIGDIKKVELDDYGLLTLVEGEASGHCHAVKEVEKVLVHQVKSQVPEIKRFLMCVTEEVTYGHVQGKLNDPEYRKAQGITEVIDLWDYKQSVKALQDDRHAPLKILPGIYEVVTQRQADLDGRLIPNPD